MSTRRQILRCQERRGGIFRRPIRGSGAQVRYPYLITEFVPAFVLAGAPDTPIRVLGGVFPVGAQVFLNGVAKTTTPISSSEVRFTLTAAEALTPGYRNAQVRTVTDGSNARLFPVNAPTATLASLAPAFAYLGTGNTATTATGTGIYAGTSARCDGATIAIASPTPTTCVLTIPAAVVNVAGDHSVELSNPPPGGGTSVARTFQARYRAPAITSKSASIIPIEAGDFEVTLTDSGGGYYNPLAWPTGGSVGSVDNVPVATTWISATQVKIVIPAAVTDVPGVKVLRVTNPTAGGGGGPSAGSNITVAVPTTTGLSFRTRVRGFDPFTLGVLGTNLLATDVARFRGEVCATTYVSPTRLDAVITAAMLAVEGAGAVDVLSDTGYVTNGQTFTVLTWDYADLGVTLRGFYPASSAVNDGFGRCSQWTEYVSGVRNPVQPDAAKRPMIVPSVPALNGKPALFFQGSADEFLEMEQWVVSTTTGVITKTEFNIWMVGSALAGSQVGANPSILGDAGGFLAYGRITATGIVALDDTSGSVFAISPFNWLSGAAFNVRVRKTGGSLYNRVNKGAEVSVVHGVNTPAFIPGNVLVGKGPSGAASFTGYVGAWLVCDSNVNRTHRAQIDNLLAHEFGTSFGSAAGVLVPTNVSPAVGAQFATPFEITVTVAGGATTGDRINVDKYVLDTIVDNATTLRGMLTAATLFTAGTKGITVSNLQGVGPPLAFTVTPFVPGLGPNLTSISVVAATRCDDPFVLDCFGSNFSATSVAYADATPLATTPDTAGHLTCVIPDAVLFVPGNKAITIHDTGGNSGAQVLTIAPWTLNSVPEISGWWESDDVNVVGSNVTQINDKTGLLRHAVQPTATKQPLLIAADPNFNGQPSIDYDGANDDMVVVGVAVNPNIFNVASWFFVTVYRADVITGSSGLTAPYANPSIASLTGSGYFGLTLRTGPLAYGYSTDGTYKVAENAAAAALVTQFAIFRKASGILYLSINGGLEAASPAMGASAFSNQNLSFGSGLTSNFFNGRITMSASFTATPSAANVSRIKNYTRVKYGWIP